MTLRLVLRLACWALSAFITSLSQVSATDHPSHAVAEVQQPSAGIHAPPDQRGLPSSV